MFVKAIRLFGAPASTILNSTASVFVSLILTRLVMLLLGEPMRPVAIWMAVICPLVVGTPLMYLHFRNMEEISRRREELDLMNQELEKALSEVKELSGLLPICSSCKKIRDDSGYWNQIEEYIKDHSKADFTHGLCPHCAEKLYPEHYKRVREKGA
jgi:uncharacterized protein YacL